jgi:hypothetical protein
MSLRKSLAHALFAAFAAASVPATAPPAVAVEPAARPQATLEWKAAKEEGVYGYVVYRATAREGPYLRVGREIVHVSRELGEVHSYRFVDATVDAGKTYFFYLDKVATTGEKTRFSGVVSKTVPATPPPTP